VETSWPIKVILCRKYGTLKIEESGDKYSLTETPLLDCERVKTLLVCVEKMFGCGCCGGGIGAIIMFCS
jgi:hypothetical protein